MKKLHSLALAMTACVGLLSTASAAPITYSVLRNISTYTVSGSLTTDGTLGTLSTANFTAWSLTITDGTRTVSIDQTNSQRIVVGTGLTADIDSIDFDFGSSGAVAFQGPTLGSGINAWCLDGTSNSCSGGASTEVALITRPVVSTARAGVVSVATATTATVPEPATFALVGVALLAAGGARRLQARA